MPHSETYFLQAVTGLLEHKSSSGIVLLLFWWQRDQSVQKVVTARQQSRSLGKLSFFFFCHELMLQLVFFLMNAWVKMKDGVEHTKIQTDNTQNESRSRYTALCM
jgi:hypothetical protein